MIQVLHKKLSYSFSKFSTVLLLIFGLSACSLQQVAYFDEGSLQFAQDISIKVDMFFGKLSQTPAEQRTFEQSQNDYLEISVQLNALLVRNQNRQYNELSVEQIQLLIELWENEETSHKQRNSFPDGLIALHRQQFQTAFASIMRAEQYKINPLH